MRSTWRLTGVQRRGAHSRGPYEPLHPTAHGELLAFLCVSERSVLWPTPDPTRLHYSCSRKAGPRPCPNSARREAGEVASFILLFHSPYSSSRGPRRAGALWGQVLVWRRSGAELSRSMAGLPSHIPVFDRAAPVSCSRLIWRHIQLQSVIRVDIFSYGHMKDGDSVGCSLPEILGEAPIRKLRGPRLMRSGRDLHGPQGSRRSCWEASGVVLIRTLGSRLGCRAAKRPHLQQV